MARLPPNLEEKRLRLIGAVRRGAFDSYVRCGWVPDAYGRIARVAEEAKNLGDSVSLASPLTRPTSFYTWRTADDDKVRDSHAALSGRVFAWSELPEHGHPGHEPNCRCWPEPYYGDPAVSDALLQMLPARRVNTDPTLLWASIDTLTRPDGSLAESTVVMNDGTLIHSTLVGSTVARQVALSTGETLRVQTVGGGQNFYLGSDSAPFLQSKWSPTGPKVVRARQHLAFLMNDPPGEDFIGDVRPNNPPGPEPMQPSLVPTAGVIGMGIIVAGVTALYEMLRTAPEVMGAGREDAPVVVYRTWTNGIAPYPGPDGKPVIVPVFVGGLAAEQAREACPLLPQVQSWTDQAAFALSVAQPELNNQDRGSVIHGMVKKSVDQQKRVSPFFYRGLFAEFSISLSGGDAYYGAPLSKRMDVLDLIPPEKPTIVCDFEIKTGAATMRRQQLRDYIVSLAARFPGAKIFLFQISPTINPAR